MDRLAAARLGLAQGLTAVRRSAGVTASAAVGHITIPFVLRYLAGHSPTGPAIGHFALAGATVPWPPAR